ncbi:unnamed protein product [Ectocarpus sp. 4 AP-2014]
MIKQRPISPSLPTTATSAATSSNGSRFASLRRAVQGRPSCSTSARTVCVLLAALCLVFFVAEMKETPSSVHNSNAAQNSASTEPEADSAPSSVVVVKEQEHEEEPQEQEEEVENMPPAVFQGGLRRFESFEEFVIVRRKSEVRGAGLNRTKWQSRQEIVGKFLREIGKHGGDDLVEYNFSSSSGNQLKECTPPLLL